MEYADVTSNFISWNFQYDIWSLVTVSWIVAFKTRVFFSFIVYGISICDAMFGLASGRTVDFLKTGGVHFDVYGFSLVWKNDNDKIGNLQGNHMNGERDSWLII